MYVDRYGNRVHTNQFSVTRHVKYVRQDASRGGMPGVFFNYELSPLMIKIEESHK